MSKLLVSNFPKNLIGLCLNFSSSARPGKGSGGKGKAHHPPVGIVPIASKKSKSREAKKLHLLNSQDPNASPKSPSENKGKEKPKKKKRSFSNADENGLPLLSPKDCFRRVEFCSKMLDILEKDPEILDSIIFSDEGNFRLLPMPIDRSDSKSGKGQKDKNNINRFHRFDESKPLPKIVWCGMTTKLIIGPYFFNSYVTDRSYIEMLRSYLLPRLKALKGISGGVENEPIEKWWFQQDGNPPHRSRNVLAYLTKTFGHSLISYGCPLMWPPKSQDLTPLDYFLWEYLKDKLEANFLPEDLCTKDKFRRSLISQIDDTDEELVSKVVREFPKRLDKCIEANGERFEFKSKDE